MCRRAVKGPINVGESRSCVCACMRVSSDCDSGREGISESFNSGILYGNKYFLSFACQNGANKDK